MGYYPVFVNLEGKKVLVVGGGRVAERKVTTLLRFGAFVSIVSQGLTDELKQLVDHNVIRHLGQDFQEAHLAGAWMVFAATDDPACNHSVSLLAQKRGLWVNAVDQPADCSFIVPAMVWQGDLCIAVSSSGKSPALAKKIRKELELQYGQVYKAFLMLMGRIRPAVLSLGLSQRENSHIFDKIVQSDILDRLSKDDWVGAKNAFSRIFPKGIDVEEIFRDVLKAEHDK